MAKRFYSEFTSIHNVDYAVEVWDSDFSGSATTFDLGAGGFSLSYSGDNNERFATIFASQIEFTFYVSTGFHTSFEFSLITATEGRFSVKVFREGSLYWVGQILPDVVEILDMPTVHGRPMVIKATDGLGRLRDIEYNNDGTAYTGWASVKTHLFEIFYKLGILSLMDSSPVKTSIGFREDSMTTGDPIALTRIQHKAFIKVDEKGAFEYMNCAEVLKELLLKFNARIIQVDGAFHVFQVGQYVANSMTVYSYDSTGTETGSATGQTYKQTDSAGTGDMIRLSGGRFSYLPPLKYVKLDYKHFTASNGSFERVIIDGNDYDIDDIPSTGQSSNILFRCTFQTKISFSNPALFKIITVKYGLKIKVGSYYYSRTATRNSNGSISYGTPVWTTSAEEYQFYSVPITTNNYNLTQQILIETPPLLSSGTMTIRVRYIEYITLNGTTVSPLDFTHTDSITNVYTELVTAGVVANRVQTTTYQADNMNANTSVGIKLESIVGDGVQDITLGRLEVYNGSAWVVANAWDAYSLGSAVILQLLINELIAGQSKPVQKIESTWEATGYKANMSIYYESTNYLPLQCRLDANRDEWSGEFFAVTRITGDVDAQSPVLKFPKPSDAANRIDKQNEIPMPTPIVEPAVRSLGVLYVSGTTPPFLSGSTVGSIPIDAPIAESVFLNGDPVLLINNITGQIQRFEVSGDVPISASYLNVVPKSVDFDIIPGAMILPDYQFMQSRINTAGTSIYNQEWDNQTSSTLTWTENGGVLPSTNTKAKIQLFQGQSKLREGIHYTISGSNFLIDSNTHYAGAYYEAIVVI